MSAVTVGALDTSGAAAHRALDLMVDAGGLSDALGLPVRATRLRHKPGLSTMAALVATGPGARDELKASAAGQLIGWVQIGSGRHRDKVVNARRRASRAGHELTEVELEGGWWLLAGSIDSDPRLDRGLREVDSRLGSIAAGLADGSIEVLRYNPNRRLVVAHRPRGSDPEVVRITAERQPSPAGMLAGLASAGVPVVQPSTEAPASRVTEAPASRVTEARASRVTRWPWVGPALNQVTDARERTALAQEAGVALAGVHAHPQTGQAWHPASAIDQLGRLMGDLRAVDSELGEEAQALAVATLRGLREHRADQVWSHGDFSADQVLVRPGGGVALIDFDRVGVMPAAADLGSFAAVELLEGEGTGAAVGDMAGALVQALIAGYRSQRELSDPLEPWIAHALLLRAMEPLRSGERHWREGIKGRLAQVAEVMS